MPFFCFFSQPIHPKRRVLVLEGAPRGTDIPRFFNPTLVRDRFKLVFFFLILPLASFAKPTQYLISVYVFSFVVLVRFG